MKEANPYPLMFSLGNVNHEKGEELPEYYQGDPFAFRYKYNYFEEDEKFYSDSNFFDNPFEDDFRSKREFEEDYNHNYQVLGLKKSASQEDIKQAFREKALQTHPDKGGDPEEFKLVREAYEELII
tara:strand:- start:649 stop:1026 length:378 start_codon:yes stop_codon:yes gene_type:complete